MKPDHLAMLKNLLEMGHRLHSYNSCNEMVIADTPEHREMLKEIHEYNVAKGWDDRPFEARVCKPGESLFSNKEEGLWADDVGIYGYFLRNLEKILEERST